MDVVLRKLDLWQIPRSVKMAGFWNQELGTRNSEPGGRAEPGTSRPTRQGLDLEPGTRNLAGWLRLGPGWARPDGHDVQETAAPAGGGPPVGLSISSNKNQPVLVVPAAC